MNLKEFVNPGKQYRPLPVWSWNATMEAAEIETRVREMKRKGFGGFFIQAGDGLKTPFLEDDWMRVVRRAVETAREAELECWLTDEDRGPAGFAGGSATENTESPACALVWYRDVSVLEEEFIADAVAFTRSSAEGGLTTVTEKPDSLEGTGMFFCLSCDSPDPRFNDGFYPDLFNYNATNRFIAAVHERYSKLFRYDFGQYMPGVFTCAPTIMRTKDFPEQNGSGDAYFPWSPGFPDWFREMHGYPPIEHLHHLLADDPEGFQFRHDYWLAVHEMFLASYTVQLSTWCREHDFKLTGRFPGEENLHGMIAQSGSLTAHYEYMDIPGVEYPGKALDKPWIARQAASVAEQLNRKRVLGILYGGGGNDLTFEEMKRIADFNFALGITTTAPKTVQFSLMGDRKRDWPPSISYHQPYWENLRVLTDYLARCSWAVGIGEPTARVLVMIPASSAMGHMSADADRTNSAFSKITASYESLVRTLVERRIPFALGDERIVRRHGFVDGTTLTVGKTDYDVVVLPPAETWRTATYDLLALFEGPIVFMGEAPARIEGVLDGRFAELATRKNVTVTTAKSETAVKKIASLIEHDIVITDSDGKDIAGVMVNHRIESGAHIVFLANTSETETKEIILSVKALGGVVELDALTGRAFRYSAEIEDDVTVIATTLYPSGSRIFLIDQTQTSLILEQPETVEERLVISGPYHFKRNQDNTLTLDTCTLTMDGKTVAKNISPTAAKKIIRQKTGIDEYDGTQPWVMERNNVRTRTNRTELVYTFMVEKVPESLSLAMESAERFTVSINGNKVEPTPGKWHMDKRIPVIDIEKYTFAGENTLTVLADYLWDTEIESIYLFGDFAVGAEKDGFPIIAEPESLEKGSWTDQGYPFYSGIMTYSMEFDIDFTESEFFEIDLSGAKGSNFSVTVNGTAIGSLPFHPFRAEITGALQQGKNEIEIEVAGSLRNTLGPFHLKDNGTNALIGPDAFEKSETKSYSFAPYGLIEPPVLLRITESEKEDAE